jgi:hypothetical protein
MVLLRVVTPVVSVGETFNTSSATPNRNRNPRGCGVGSQDTEEQGANHVESHAPALSDIAAVLALSLR